MADLTPTNSENILPGRRISRPSAALLNDPAQAALPSQREAATNFLLVEREKRAQATVKAIADARQSPITTNPSPLEPESPAPVLPTSKRPYVEEVVDEEETGVRENARVNPKPKRESFIRFTSSVLSLTDGALPAKKSRTSHAPNDPVDASGIPIDIDVQSISGDETVKVNKNADLDHFFEFDTTYSFESPLPRLLSRKSWRILTQA